MRFSASVNSTGACIIAATVWPGSIWRDSTMPSIGERIEDSSMFVSSTPTAARHWFDRGPRARRRGLGALQRRARGVELGLRGHLAARELGDVTQAREVRARLVHRGLRLQHLRLGRGERGARLRQLVLQLRGVEPREHLARCHDVVVVDEHRLDGARELAADVDLVGRLQVAGGRHRHDEVAAPDGLGAVLDGTLAVAGEPQQRAGEHRDPGADERQEPAPAVRVRCGGEYLRELVGLARCSGHRVLVCGLSGCSWLQPPPSAL